MQPRSDVGTNYFCEKPLTLPTCQKAYADLKKKCEIIKDAYEFFNADYERMNEMMMTFRDNVLKMLQDKGDAIV